VRYLTVNRRAPWEPSFTAFVSVTRFEKPVAPKGDLAVVAQVTQARKPNGPATPPTQDAPPAIANHHVQPAGNYGDET
jgi:hypothetical protein